MGRKVVLTLCVCIVVFSLLWLLYILLAPVPTSYLYAIGNGGEEQLYQEIEGVRTWQAFVYPVSVLVLSCAAAFGCLVYKGKGKQP